MSELALSNWPYRDWVIDAIDSDMPFDRFTIEQLAGDLLPEATLDQQVATGFLRSVPLNLEAGVARGGRARLPGHRSRQHRGDDLARYHDRVRAVSRPQVRSAEPGRVLPPARVLQRHREGGGVVRTAPAASTWCRAAPRSSFRPPSARGRAPSRSPEPCSTGSTRAGARSPQGRRRSRRRSAGSSSGRRTGAAPSKASRAPAASSSTACAHCGESSGCSPGSSRGRPGSARAARSGRRSRSCRSRLASTARSPSSRTASSRTAPCSSRERRRCAARTSSTSGACRPGRRGCASRRCPMPASRVAVRVAAPGRRRARSRSRRSRSPRSHPPANGRSRSRRRSPPRAPAGARPRRRSTATRSRGGPTTARHSAARSGSRSFRRTTSRSRTRAGSASRSISSPAEAGCSARLRISATTAERDLVKMPPAFQARLVATPYEGMTDFDRSILLTLGREASLPGLRLAFERAQREARALERPPRAHVIKEEAEPRTTHVFERGDHRSPGAVVTPGTPAILPPMRADLPRNRLGFARWLVDSRQPAHRARRRQPLVGAAPGTRARRHAGRLRHSRRASGPPRAAGLACRRVHGVGLEPQGGDPRDRDVRDLPAGVRFRPASARSSAIPRIASSRAIRRGVSRPSRFATMRCRSRDCSR